MQSFNPLGAGVSGLGYLLTRPHIVLIWAAAYFIAIVAIFEGTQFLRPEIEPGATPLVYILALIVIGIFHQTVMLSAAFRSVLQPSPVGLAHLRLGRAEASQLGMAGLAQGGVRQQGIVLAAMLGLVAIVAAAALLGNALGHQGPAAAAVGFVLGWLLVLAATVYVGTKWAVARVAAFNGGLSGALRAWDLTKGWFWPLLLTEAVAKVVWLIACAGVVVAALYASALIAGPASGPPARLTAADLDLTRGLDVLAPQSLLIALVGALFMALRLAMFDRPLAMAYAALRQHGREQSRGPDLQTI
jgi:hypothetical protein